METIRTDAEAIAWLEEHGYLHGGTELHNHDGVLCIIDHGLCYRCGGRGNVGYGPFGGVCFRCGGTGRTKREKHTPVKKYAQAKKRNERERERERERYVAEKFKREAEKEERMLEGQRNWCEAHGLGRITFAERDAMREAERAAKRARKTWVGTIGKREEFEVTVVFTTCWDTQWGTTELVAMEDQDGNKLVWRATGCTELDKGMKARIRGTVKDHDTYKDEKQTVLQRVAVLEVLTGMEPEKEAA